MMFEELVKTLEDGKFYAGQHTLLLQNRKGLWVGHGWTSYSPYPAMGTSFTLREKWRLRRAIKIGQLKQLVSRPNEET